METQEKTFNELLAEASAKAGFSAEKLSMAAGVPFLYIEAFFNGAANDLPAAPYIRGYLLQIADAIGADGNYLWQSYKQTYLVRGSGSTDRLPLNRFAKKTSLQTTPIILVSGFVFVAVVAIWGVGFLRAPRIIISAPENNLVASASSIILSGRVDNRDKLVINGEEVVSGNDGDFSKEFMLQDGVNTFEFKVKRFLGKETKVIRQVIYQREKISSISEENINVGDQIQ